MSRPVAPVTGASRGIGAQTAKLAAARGWAVGVGFREREEAAQAVVWLLSEEASYVSGQIIGVNGAMV